MYLKNMFEPFLCKKCGYTSFDGKPHACTPKQQRVSFYSRRYSKCISCIFNENGFCFSDGTEKLASIDNFYSSCPESFWLPVIFNCDNCNTLLINTNESLLQCPKCKQKIQQPRPFTKEFKKTEKRKLDPSSSKKIPVPSNIASNGSLVGDPNSIKKDFYITESPKRELIVSKYGERIDWLNYVPDNIDVITVYDKGHSFSLSPKFPDERIRFVKLENVGREANTWLYHFISRWDTLAETTFLAQGNPFEHSPDFLDFLELEYDETIPLTKLYTIGFNYSSKPGIRNRYVRQISSELEINFGHPEVNKGFFNIIRIAWGKLFLNKMPRPFLWGTGAMYALKKEDIINTRLKDYKKMYSSKINAHQAEGLWYNIFTNRDMEWR